MSLKNKKQEVRKKLFGKGAKIVFAPTDEDSEREFRALLKLRKEYRELGGIFKKK